MQIKVQRTSQGEAEIQVILKQLQDLQASMRKTNEQKEAVNLHTSCIRKCTRHKLFSYWENVPGTECLASSVCNYTTSTKRFLWAISFLNSVSLNRNTGMHRSNFTEISNRHSILIFSATDPVRHSSNKMLQ